MLDLSTAPLVLGFAPLALALGLGGWYLYSLQETAMTQSYPHDAWLKVRMGERDLPTWQALQQAAGLSRTSLQKLRRGHCQRLRWEQLEQVAQALQWPLETLLVQLDLIAPPAAPAPPEADPAAALEHLRQECMALRQDLAQQDAASTQAATQQSFFELQPLLTQFPTVPRMVEVQPNLPARNLLPLFNALQNWLARWEIRPIGEPWQPVPFDPRLHQPDGGDMEPEETVYVRFVGYRQGDDILVRAKVSRTLPAAASQPS
jgi:DNA-binding Xre family transcriptional regulator